jgi:hypothetical protein
MKNRISLYLFLFLLMGVIALTVYQQAAAQTVNVTQQAEVAFAAPSQAPRELTVLPAPVRIR